MATAIHPTDNEVFFDANDIIVSKTDRQGRIVYANSTFLNIAGYTEREVLGQPHSIIRHPDMPRAVFKVLWDTVLGGQEIFAYVKNMAKSGDYYWVFAHVTPSFDLNGEVASFHSNRRVPRRPALEAIAPIYADVARVEAQHRNGKDGLSAGVQHLLDLLKSKKMSYEEFVLAL